MLWLAIFAIGWLYIWLIYVCCYRHNLLDKCILQAKFITQVYSHQPKLSSCIVLPGCWAHEEKIKLTLSLWTSPKLSNFSKLQTGEKKTNKQHLSKVRLNIESYNEWSHFKGLSIESKVKKHWNTHGSTVGAKGLMS